MRRRSLALRLIGLSALSVLLPALIISWAHRKISSSALEASIQAEQTELARRIAEEVDGKILHARGLLSLVARSSFFGAGSRIDQYEALRNLLREVPTFQEVMVVNPQGEELLKVSPGRLPLPLIRRAGNFSEPYIGTPFFSGNRYPTILLGEPIRTFANPIRRGAVVAKMSFTGLGELLKQTRVGPRGVAFVVDQRGNLLAHPDENLVYAHGDWSHLPVARTWRQRPAEPTGLQQYVDERGVPMVALAHPIPLLNSAVVVQQPRADVFAPIQRMRVQFILWTLLSVGLVLALTVGLAWRILQPLRRLRGAAERVGRGEWDVQLDIRTGDELEDLGRTFERMAASLAQLERMRGDLISMVVHDLKMPLSTILPSIECLLAGDFGRLTAQQAHFMEMARRSGQEMLMLIQNLLDVAKMEDGKLFLCKERLAPGDWAESVVSSFRPLAEAGKKTLTLVESGALEPIDGDPALLGRVLGNLISNALRHTPAGTGEVTVTLFLEGNQLAVQVRDNGEGIPEEDQQRIFDKFAQGQRTPLRSGTGLGLTFCKMVVEAHGGRISVYSQPAEGSLFTFHLPRRAAAAASLEPAPAPAPEIASLPTD